jgi:predicted exporter
METIGAVLFQSVYHDSAAQLSQDTGKWFTVLGLVGLVTYALMAVKRPKCGPSDLALCIFSMGICAIGGLVLAHPGGAALNKVSLNSGAALIWSVGAPISDVVAVST